MLSLFAQFVKSKIAFDKIWFENIWPKYWVWKDLNLKYLVWEDLGFIFIAKLAEQ